MWWDLGVNVKRYHVAETIETTRNTLYLSVTWGPGKTPKQKHRGERSS